MNFKQAVDELRKGAKVRRATWEAGNCLVLPAGADRTGPDVAFLARCRVRSARGDDYWFGSKDDARAQDWEVLT